MQMDHHSGNPQYAQSNGVDAQAAAAGALTGAALAGWAAVGSEIHGRAGELAQALAECHRVVRPGGALIVETLNPENPDVAAGGFALDPTRFTPLPPALLEALVRGSGFAQTAQLPEGTRGEKPRVYAAVAFREA